MADSQDSKSLGAKELALYNALLKHWIDVNEPDSVDDEQIDDLFNEPIKLVPWSTGTDEEIGAMINGYYNGDLTLEQIQSVWNLGDCRTVSLSAMGAINVEESHRAQNVEIRIIDFNYDKLTNSINNKTKALITVELKNCLRDATVSDDNGKYNTERGYMNSTATNIGGWGASARRAWCNHEFYNSLPSIIKNLVKSVEKITYEYNSDTIFETTSDFIFIPSLDEIICGGLYAYHHDINDDESIFDRQQKLPKWDSSYYSSRYWLRTPDNEGNATDNRFFKIINYFGDDDSMAANGVIGIAPAFCL